MESKKLQLSEEHLESMGQMMKFNDRSKYHGLESEK